LGLNKRRAKRKVKEEDVEAQSGERSKRKRTTTSNEWEASGPEINEEVLGSSEILSKRTPIMILLAAVASKKAFKVSVCCNVCASTV